MPSDFAVLLFLLSPNSSGRRCLENEARSPGVDRLDSWPRSSSMGVGLFALFGDAEMAREEAITHQQTTHMGGSWRSSVQGTVGSRSWRS